MIWFLKSKGSPLTEERLDQFFDPFFERIEEWSRQRLPDKHVYDEIEGDMLVPDTWRPSLPPAHFVKCWRQLAFGLRKLVQLGKENGFEIFLEHLNQNAVEGMFSTCRCVSRFSLKKTRLKNLFSLL